MESRFLFEHWSKIEAQIANAVKQNSTCSDLMTLQYVGN